jgi:hypothetical protein
LRRVAGPLGSSNQNAIVNFGYVAFHQRKYTRLCLSCNRAKYLLFLRVIEGSADFVARMTNWRAFCRQWASAGGCRGRGRRSVSQNRSVCAISHVFQEKPVLLTVPYMDIGLNLGLYCGYNKCGSRSRQVIVSQGVLICRQIRGKPLHTVQVDIYGPW